MKFVTNRERLSSLRLMSRTLGQFLAVFSLFVCGACAQATADRAELPNAPSSTPPPFSTEARFQWVVHGTVGPESLAAGVFSAAIGTAMDRPHEYGPHWTGFGQRYGMRLTGVATSNIMEAGLGALWGEDPRYFPLHARSRFKGRLKHVIVATFTAQRPDGNSAPAYARLIAIPGSNFLSNTWRADSEANAHDAVLRTLLGFAARMTHNAWDEFQPFKR